MHFDVHYWIQQYGYFGVFITLLLEMIGIPFPGSTILTLSGIEWTKGTFSLLPLLFFAIVGNIVGSSIAYAIGRFFGRSIILRFGKKFGITIKKFEKAEKKFRMYRVSIILFAKFIPGFRELIAYLAGIERMSFIMFSIYNTIGTLLWVTIFVFFGRYVQVAWEKYHQTINQYLLPLTVLGVMILTIYIGRKIRLRKTKSTE